MKLRSRYLLGATAACGLATGCAGTQGVATRPGGAISVVAVERVYGDLAAQIGGSDVAVTTILGSPAADPHEYEPTARDADAVADAQIVVENGLGYDAFTEKLLSASPLDGRAVVVAGSLAGHVAGDNPHVWYETATLRAVVDALAGEIGRRRPTHRAAIDRRRDTLRAWVAGLGRRLAALGAAHPHASVAITEPVFDDVLHEAGVRIATPESFSHAIEEGDDPAPQDQETMRGLLASRSVAAFVYNEQTVEPVTSELRALALAHGVPVVSVTETLPDRRSTQAWIDGEVAALARAL